jgi:hypothetical protein
VTTPIFSDEVQLAGWSDSHNSGAKVTFWLKDPEQLAAFRGMTERKGKTAGQRLAMVLVEINDDETLGSPQPEKEKPGPLCMLAVQWCKDENFQGWLLEPSRRFVSLDWEKDARAMLLHKCQIQSRRDLDTNPEAANLFQTLIRTPFMAYLDTGVVK